MNAVSTNSHVLEVRNLDYRVPISRRQRRDGQTDLHIVKDVSVDIDRAETLALVGESGSGKSTFARALMHLIPPSAGSVTVAGTEWTGLSKEQLRANRRHVQMVFQDPYSSLDPSMLVWESVAEPLRVHTDLSATQRYARVGELFEIVGLAAHHLHRNPYEFSGGQRQRIAIARALALDPQLVVCDEAVSALDVSTQNQIIALLRKLQSELDVAYLFISHDLAVVRHIASRIAVMYFGRIVESGPSEQVFNNPMHPYTAALLSSVPIANPRVQRLRQQILIRGEVPDLAKPPRGCAFASRCPQAQELCKTDNPPTVQIAGISIACHFPLHSEPNHPTSSKESETINV